jgi:starch synthase
MGLKGLIRTRGGSRVSGILNGIDPIIWNPQKTCALAARYDSHNLAMRRANKRAIESGFGLTPGDGLLFTVISRLSWQKGMDVLAEQLDTLVALGGRLALLGTGERALKQNSAPRQPAIPDGSRWPWVMTKNSPICCRAAPTPF